MPGKPEQTDLKMEVTEGKSAKEATVDKDLLNEVVDKRKLKTRGTKKQDAGRDEDGDQQVSQPKTRARKAKEDIDVDEPPVKASRIRLRKPRNETKTRRKSEGGTQVQLEECTVEEQRAVARFLWASGLDAKDIHNEMISVYGDQCLSQETIQDCKVKQTKVPSKPTNETPGNPCDNIPKEKMDKQVEKMITNNKTNDFQEDSEKETVVKQSAEEHTPQRQVPEQ